MRTPCEHCTVHTFAAAHQSKSGGRVATRPHSTFTLQYTRISLFNFAFHLKFESLLLICTPCSSGAARVSASPSSCIRRQYCARFLSRRTWLTATCTVLCGLCVMSSEPAILAGCWQTATTRYCTSWATWSVSDASIVDTSRSTSSFANRSCQMPDALRESSSDPNPFLVSLPTLAHWHTSEDFPAEEMLRESGNFEFSKPQFFHMFQKNVQIVMSLMTQLSNDPWAMPPFTYQTRMLKKVEKYEQYFCWTSRTAQQRTSLLT